MRRILAVVLLLCFFAGLPALRAGANPQDSVLKILAECEAFRARQAESRARFQALHGDGADASSPLPAESVKPAPEAEDDGFAALAGAVGRVQETRLARNAQALTPDLEPVKPEDRQVYIVGAGIGGLSAAVFLVRDGGIPGKNIHVMEELPINGGAMDGIGTPEGGYVIRGGRMLNFPTYECFWTMLKSIPSLDNAGKSVMDDIEAFNGTFQSNSQARLVDRNREIVDGSHWKLGAKDRLALMKLTVMSEKALGNRTIEECFPPSFFQTNFWYLWATTFAFQPWHSAVEMKRYMNRFNHECPRLHNLAGINRTQLNQYDCVILPIQKWLQGKGVTYSNKVRVVDADFAPGSGRKTVERLHVVRQGKREAIQVRPQDLVFFTNGSMTDSSVLGSMTKAPSLETKGTSFLLWENMARKVSGLGNPAAFADDVQKSKWESFTVTCKDPTFFRLMEEFSGNVPGTGGLVTFKDSGWLMSIVLPRQPHFKNQPSDVQVFWGYALFGDRLGDCVKKPMSDCTGEEILTEILHHLRFSEHAPLILRTSNCIPCMMPFITAQFMPRNRSDRPEVVPAGATNFGFVSQFCEIPDDCVFTVEYSVRAAQIAVYTLLGIEKKIPAINEYWKQPKVIYQTLKTMFR